MSKIFMSQPDEFGCGHYRAKFPVMHCFGDLAKEGCYLDSHKDLMVDQDDYDAYIFHRSPADTLVFHADTLRRSGKKIVWQVDDDLWNIPSWMPSEESANLWSLNKALTVADEVWVSTDRIAKVTKHSNIKVLPNLIDTNAFPVPGAAKDDPIRILWCGGRSHERDLQLLIEPVEQLVLEYGSRVQFVFWGYIPTDMLEYSRISGTMNAMVRPKAEYGDAVWFLDGLPFRNFYDKLAKMRPYIALMPLIDCDFNHGKTNLKYLEMSVAGAASIASAITPYVNTISNGNDGVLVDNSPNSWYNAIRDLIEHPEKRDHLARNAYAKVVEQYSWQSPARQLWVDAFKDLV
jgi:glycosyltransferase involved in cell wall biosynthesis